jgi:hypothetical protein
MLALSFVFPDKVPIKATEGALWHNKRSQLQGGERYREEQAIDMGSPK